MKKYLIGFIATLLSFGVLSCKKEDAELVQHDILNVTGPVTGSVGSAVGLTVNYPYNGGCDYIGSFEEKRSGNIVTIKAYTKPVSKKAICTMELGFRNIEYNFTSNTTGTFELKFMKTDGSSISHTLTIQ